MDMMEQRWAYIVIGEDGSITYTLSPDSELNQPVYAAFQANTVGQIDASLHYLAEVIAEVLGSEEGP